MLHDNSAEELPLHQELVTSRRPRECGRPEAAALRTQAVAPAVRADPRAAPRARPRQADGLRVDPMPHPPQWSSQHPGRRDSVERGHRVPAVSATISRPLVAAVRQSQGPDGDEISCRSPRAQRPVGTTERDGPRSCNGPPEDRSTNARRTGVSVLVRRASAVAPLRAVVPSQ